MAKNMEIRVAFLPELAGDVSEAVCIVIDVLRATTVIATLFDRNCPAVYVAPRHDLAEAFARKQGYVLCGETKGLKAPGFDFGNSPCEFAKQDFAGRRVVLSTTNGTKATAMVAKARAVFLGAALNRMTVALEAWRVATELESDIVIVCSGTNGEYTLEDAMVAGGYVEALVAQGSQWNIPLAADSAIAARRLWQNETNLLRGMMEGKHAQYLGDVGFGEDIGYCCAVDVNLSAPRLCSEQEIDSIAYPVVLVVNPASL